MTTDANKTIQEIKQQQFNFLMKLAMGLIATLFTLIGWFGNMVWHMVGQQQQVLTNVQLELARNYVPRVELQERLKTIDAKLDELLRSSAFSGPRINLRDPE